MKQLTQSMAAGKSIGYTEKDNSDRQYSNRLDTACFYAKYRVRVMEKDDTLVYQEQTRAVYRMNTTFLTLRRVYSHKFVIVFA